MVKSQPQGDLGGGSVRSRSGTRYVFGLLEDVSNRLEDKMAARSEGELKGRTYYIRASLFFSATKKNI
jgi:hypothetical protein